MLNRRRQGRDKPSQKQLKSKFQAVRMMIHPDVDFPARSNRLADRLKCPTRIGVMMQDARSIDNIEHLLAIRRIHQVHLDKMNARVVGRGIVPVGRFHGIGHVGRQHIAAHLRDPVRQRSVPAAGIEHPLARQRPGRAVHLFKEQVASLIECVVPGATGLWVEMLPLPAKAGTDCTTWRVLIFQRISAGRM